MISLSKHIERLLLDHDLVIVPTFGGFLTNNNEASHISADENSQDTLVPPTRTIGFNPSLTINDGLLVQSYMHHYDASYPQAFKQMEFDIKQMLQSLNNNGSYTFANIGTVTLDMHQRLQFTAQDNVYFAPMFYGLPQLKLQSAAAMQHQRNIQDAIEQTSTLTVVRKKDNKKSATRHTGHHRWIDITISAAAAIVLFFALFHNTLKTKTESQPVMVSSCIVNSDSNYSAQDTTKSQENVSVAEEENAVALETVAEPVTEYAIILASGVTLPNAETYINHMKTQGYDGISVFTQNNYHRIAFKFYNTREAASIELSKLRGQSSEFTEAWIMEVNR